MSFRFKQFYIEDSRCAMKVGTDGVLLGAWVSESGNGLAVTGYRRILDVGTGSGLVALMLAQRCPNAQIDAIDIDEAAVEQAKENVERAQNTDRFTNRIQTYHARLQEWHGGPYDLIVSNPPYFRNSLKNPDKGRELARHTDSLSYEELVKHSAAMLREGGQLAVILPAEAESVMRELAEQHSLFITRVTRVYSKQTKPVRRVLMAFMKFTMHNSQCTIIEDTLVLEDEKGGRSLPYQKLAKDFYL